MRYPLVQELAADKIPVVVTCRVLGFSKQAFYQWQAAPVSQRDWDDAHLINALMESVIGLFKTECIRTTVFHARPFKTLGDVEYATAGWVDWWNNRRLHGTLGMITPSEAEQAYYAALIPQAQPA